MTLEEFTFLRRDELIRFFEARFGRHWRQTVAQQAGLHPRTFQYWKYSRATSLYRQLLKLERWARTVGFESATDEKVHDRILALQKFKQVAKQEVEEAQGKRKALPSGFPAPDSHEISRKIHEAMSRIRAAAAESHRG